MAIPDFQSLMLPLLKAVANGNERSNKELVSTLAEQFRLTEEELEEKLSSGQHGRLPS